MRSTLRARVLPSPRLRGLMFPAAFCIALLYLAASLNAQTAPWRSFSSSADRFHALFPVEPQVSRNSVPVGNDTFELHSYEEAAGSSSLYIGVCDYGVKGAAANPYEMLASAKKGAVEHMSAHVLAEKRITLGPALGASGPGGSSPGSSSPGVEFQAESAAVHFAVRMYMAGGVLYQTMVATPLHESFADTARFLDSFALLPPALPLPARPTSARSAPQGPTPTTALGPGPDSKAAAEENQYRYADDGFSAWFPSPPALQSQKINTLGGPVDLRTYVVENRFGALIAAVCNYGPAASGKDPEVLLEDARRGAMENLRGRLTGQRKITAGAYHGIEFEADSDAAHVSARVYLVGTRLYQMIVASPASSRSADTERFLSSFQLILPRAAHE